MKFDPTLFHELVDHMYNGMNYSAPNNDVDHALRRTIVSRLYYSILLQIASKNKINARGVSDSHRMIAEKLQKRDRHLLNDMKGFREDADYNLDIFVDYTIVEDQFDLYDTLLQRI